MIRMAKVGALAALVIGTMVACSTAPASQAGRDDLVRRAGAALTAWNQQIPGIEGFARGSYGYAMFPEIGKGGVGLGGAYGRGVVYAGGQHVGYADLSQATVGVQLGGQSYGELIVFATPAALERFKQGRTDGQVGTSAVLIESGYAANIELIDDATIFLKPNGGAMGEMVVAGQRVTFVPK